MIEYPSVFSEVYNERRKFSDSRINLQHQLLHLQNTNKLQ